MNTQKIYFLLALLLAGLFSPRLIAQCGPGQDIIPPVALCQNTTLLLDPLGNATLNPADVDNGSFDACGIQSLTVNNNQFDCSFVGNNFVTLTVTDSAGNTSTCTSVLLVEDIFGPTVACQDLTVFLGPGGTASIVPSQVLDTFFDPCGIASIFAQPNTFTVLDTGPLPNPVTAGAIDNNGNTSACISLVTVLGQGSPLTISLSSPVFACGHNISCHDAADGTIATAVSGGSPPYSYLWSDGQTSPVLSGLSEGTWSLTVTDNLGDISTAVITLTAPSPLTYNLDIPADCDGFEVSPVGANNGQIDLTVEGGAYCLPYQYNWTGPNNFMSTDEDLENLFAGEYGLTVQDANGCTLSNDAILLTDPDYMFPGFVIDAGPDQTVYAGYPDSSQATLTGTILGGTPPYNIQWSNGVTSLVMTVSPLETTTYTLTVTDAEGETLTDDVTVNVIDISCEPGSACEVQIKGNEAICLGETSTLTAFTPKAGGQFEWKVSNETGKVKILGDKHGDEVLLEGKESGTALVILNYEFGESACSDTLVVSVVEGPVNLNFTIASPTPNAVIDASLVPELPVQISTPDAMLISGVLFESSPDGINWTVFDMDDEHRDGFEGHWNIISVPAQTYILRATAFDVCGGIHTATVEISVTGSTPSPIFLSPLDQSEITGQVLLEIGQDGGTADWSSVEFEYSSDGFTFTSIAVDANGGDGWSTLWDTDPLELNGYIIRATVTNQAGLENSTFIRVALFRTSNFYNHLSTGPITMDSYTTSGGALFPLQMNVPNGLPSQPGTFDLSFNPGNFPGTPSGDFRVGLVMDLLGDTLQRVVAVVNTDQTQVSIPIHGIEPGSYRVVATLAYFDGVGEEELRSEEYLIDFGLPNGFSVPTDQILTELGRTGVQLLGTGGTGFVYTVDRSAQDRFGVTLSSNTTQGPLQVALSDVSFGNTQSTLFFTLINTGLTPLSDNLSLQTGYWDLVNGAVLGSPVSIPYSLLPGDTQTVSYAVPGLWGSMTEYSLVTLESIHTGGTYVAGTVLSIGNEMQDLDSLIWQIGGDGLDLCDWKGGGQRLKAGYPEYHWVRSRRVTNTLPAAAAPNGTYTWTVINSNGSSWTSTGKTLRKHASIIGGPHEVRVTCIGPDGTVVVYGSDHFVHPPIRSVTVISKTTTTEYERGKELVGLTGPGVGNQTTLSYTQGVSATRSTSVTATVGGQIGVEGVAAISGEIGATQGQAVTQSNSTSFSFPIPPGKCYKLYERLCFEVTRGTIRITFTDGSSITSSFTSRKLSSVGYEPVECPC